MSVKILLIHQDQATFGAWEELSSVKGEVYFHVARIRAISKVLLHTQSDYIPSKTNGCPIILQFVCLQVTSPRLL